MIYEARSGYARTAIASNTDLSVDNLDVEGLLSSDAIDDEDVRAGLYDYAGITVFLVNYEDLTMGAMILRKGWFGEVHLKDQLFTTEMRGLTQALSRQLLETYTPSCLAELGDARCTVDLTAFTAHGTVGAVAVPRLTFAYTTDRPDLAGGIFRGGRATFGSGAAAGRTFEVKLDDSDGLTLFARASWEIAPGDVFTVVAGCDKNIFTCRDLYDNVVNFRGFPWVPNRDKFLQYPDSPG